MPTMSDPSDVDKVKQILKNDLAEGLVAGYPEDRVYVPRNCLQDRITQLTIKRCLPDARGELLDFIASKARKVFAILLYSSGLPIGTSLKSAMQRCQDRGLTDTVLPLPRRFERCICRGDRALCRHGMAQDTLGKWTAYCWEQFYTTQWMFIGLEFKADVFDYTLDEQIILPIRLRDGHGEGSFGEVSEGELNQEHARESEKSSRPRYVAIKLFKNFIENDHQGLAARNAWEMEAQNLRELSKRNHPHLIHRIATVTHGKRFLILSDWANGGDLKTFWEQNPKPSVDSTLVREVVAQLSGLASAIELMHHGYHTGTLSRSVSHYPLPPTNAPPVIISPDVEADRAAEIDAPVEDSNWRHGDLKPENILRFLETGQLVGTLRISDLGLAKRHVEATGIRKHASSSQFGTRAYEPPEAVTRLLAPRSRLYDIWSFGCVMLEFVVWLLYGHRGLDEFWHLPVQPDETLFWSKVPGDSGPGAEVNRTVTQIIDNILATNPACRSPSAIGDLLLLIKNRVLVPALPGVHNTIMPQHQRVHADVLLKLLEDIERKCKSRDYCCPGRPEHDARLPIPSRPIRRNMPDSLRPPPVTYGKEMANLQVPSGAARAQRVIPK